MYRDDSHMTLEVEMSDSYYSLNAKDSQPSRETRQKKRSSLIVSEAMLKY